MTHYDELSAVLQSTANDIRVRYTELYRILCLVLVEATADSDLSFSGPFARLTFLATKHQMSDRLRLRLNACRGRCRELATQETETLEAALPFDVLTVADLLSLVSGTSIPHPLSALLPRGKTIPFVSKRITDYMRVCVLEWDDETILARPDGMLAEEVRIACASESNRLGKWDYLLPLLSEGTQLNLVHVEERDGVLYPEIIILEPDYLVDISAIAACFTEHGASLYVHLLKRLQSQPHSRAILMGNMAGQMLDEEVNRHTDEATIPYRETALRFMHRYAMELATETESMAGFHEEAIAQQQNIRSLLAAAAREDDLLRMDHLLIEPSFFCEMLGLQGRMDLMQDDFRVLVEQKSGKRDFLTGSHKEPHYVQMLLYQAVLHYAFAKRNDEISSYLLYSKYPDGLIKETPAPRLLFEALQLRNQIVWGEFQLSRGGSEVLDHLTPEHLNTRQLSSRLWTEFKCPAYEAVLSTIQQADPLAAAYFHRMMTFVAREHLLAKIGSPMREASGFASLWNSSSEEKKVAGNLFAELQIERTWSDDGSDSVDRLLLQRPQETHDYLPNYRSGDIVLLYSYHEGQEPDVRSAIVSRAYILEISTSHILLQLRATQRNALFFRQEAGRLWAVEHDSTESSFTALYRSVFSLLTATPERRQLLLAQREPRVDTSVRLRGTPSSDFSQLVLQAMQARDYFILIGPPGTGKTSFGLMNILREELLNEEGSVLLISYTNRAIDEICSKLLEAGLPFLRISSSQVCPEAYRPYLVSEHARTCQSVAELRRELTEARIVVGTTTSLTSQQSLFSLRSFSLAIIDEASQILEPHLMGLLCARHGEVDAIGRFCLIGDHKQLPAVVQQEPSESVVDDEMLHSIGLFDCRESLFQRLLRLQSSLGDASSSPFVFRFTRQGRMHPEVAQFAATHFYEDRLHPVPLPHQQQALRFPSFDAADPLQSLLSRHRVLFLPVERPAHSVSPKVNEAEARLIASIARAVYSLYEQNGRPFLPDQTLGIIVPYRHQIAVVRKHIAGFGLEGLDAITVDTVERYQGSQRDVIVYGFTIQMPHQLDFLCAQSFEEEGHTIDRRLNVALTRAREQMVLIGNPRLLALNPLLASLLQETFTVEADLLQNAN